MIREQTFEGRRENLNQANKLPGCPIKGNINRRGEKIYHTPWSPWYDRTQVVKSKSQHGSAMRLKLSPPGSVPLGGTDRL